MRQRNRLGVVALAVAVILSGTLTLGGRLRPQDANAPRSLEEVVAVAEQRGLHWRSDRRDGLIANRVLVAEAPLTFEQASLISCASPEQPAGRGTVVVYRHGASILDMPSSAVLWGGVLLFGDPGVIHRLTGAPAEALPRVAWS